MRTKSPKAGAVPHGTVALGGFASQEAPAEATATEGADALSGTSGDDFIHGLGGNDHIRGLDGADRLVGGQGDDVIEGGAGADELDGGGGVDTLSYAGSDAAVTVRLGTGQVSGGHAQGDTIARFAHVTGSVHNDTLIGSAGGNILDGGDGDDFLGGLDGNDVLRGGAGADRLKGGVGDDRLSGGAGDDLLYGEVGADVLDGGDGVDTADYSTSAGRVVVRLDYGTGRGGDAEGDTLLGVENLVGSAGGDTLFGEAGANRLEGRDGDDCLDGQAGDDVLEGGDGADRIFGREGDDQIDGGWGADQIDGGDGDDTVSYAGSAGRVIARLDLGTGRGGQAEGDTLTGVENLVGSAGNDTLFGEAGANRLEGRDGDDYLDGQAGDDVLEGGDGADRIFGREGDDLLDGGWGADQIDGGDGDDTVSYAGSAGRVIARLDLGTGRGGQAEGDTLAGVENLVGSDHNDTLFGEAGANRLEGGAGDDYLDGQAGDDRLVGGDGADRIFGQAGDDLVLGGAGADQIDGGAGVDTIDYSASADAVTVRLHLGYGEGADAEGDTYAGVENLIGTERGDKLFGDGAANRFDGGAGNDFLDGGDGADGLLGGFGNDRIYGRAGDDLVEGGWGGDLMEGGDGIDTLSYAGSNNRVVVRLDTGAAASGHAAGDSFSGFENLVGSAHADSLTGSAGANEMRGEDGDDFLGGQAGDDLLLGGAGDDRIAGGAGADRLAGGTGHDTLMYTTSGAGVTVRLSTGAVSGGEAEGDVISGFESVIGSRHRDTLIGSSVANRLEGGDDDDFLGGMDGDDVLVGGAGADRLNGGAGADLFVFAGLSGQDTVQDFDIAGGDRAQFDLGSYADFDELMAHAADTADGVLIARDGQSVLLSGVTRAQLTAGAFEFVAAAGAPAPAADQVDGTEDQAVTFAPLANDPGAAGLTITRVDGQAITVGGTVEIDGVGSVTLNADLTLTFTPLTGLNGPQTISYTVRNAAGLSATAEATVDLAGVSAGVTLTVSAGTNSWTGGTVQANPTDSRVQQFGSVGALEDGGHVVTWVSGAGGYEANPAVQAQRFNADGVAVGGVINVGVAPSNANTATLGLADGGFLVVWQASDGLKGQFYTSAGAAQGSAILLEAASFMASSAVLSAIQTADGDIIVAYNGFRLDGPSGTGVAARRLTADRQLEGERFVLSEATDGHQGSPHIAAAPDGGFMAVWMENDGLHARSFGADGEGGPASLVRAYTADDRDPGVAVLDNGTAVVVWTALRPTGGTLRDVWARRLDADGQPVGEAFLIGTGGQAPQPNIHALPDGGFAVAFSTTSEVTVRRYDANGVAVGGSVTTPRGLTGNDSLAVNEAGELVVFTTIGTWPPDVGFRRLELPNAFETDEDIGVALSLAMSQVDPDEHGQVLIEGLPEGSVLSAGSLQDDGSWLVEAADLAGLTLTPPADFSGLIQVTATAFTDGDIANGARRTFGVDVRPINDAPRPVADVIDSLEDYIVTFSPLANDLEVEGESMTITHINGVAVSAGQSVAIAGVGSLKLNADGTLSFTPLAHWSGEQGFTYTVRDASGASTTGSGLLRLDGVTDGATFSYGQLADWTPAAIDPADVRVNAYTNGTQSQASVTALTDGGYLITWVSDGQDGSGTGVFAQRYDRLGQKVGDEHQVNELTAGNQQDTAVLAMDDGGWVIAWRGPITGQANTGIYVRRYDADGQASPTQLVTDAAYEQTYGGTYNHGSPTLATLPDGGFIIGWTTFFSGTDTDIWTRRYDAAGTPQTARVTRADEGLEDHMQLLTNAEGKLFIVMQEVDGPYSGPTSGWDRDYGIYLWNEDWIQLNTTIVGNQTHPTLTVLANGNMVAAWQSADASGTGIVFRLLDEDGQPILAERWANRTTAGNQSSPGVVALADGTFLVLWTSAGTDGSGAGIYGQRISADGSRYLGAEFRLNATTTGDQLNDSAITDTSFAVLADGTLVATWWGDGEVHQRRFDPPEAAFTAYEGEPIAIPLTVNLVDASETFELAISNLPPGSVLSAGTQRADGAWVVTAEEAASLTLTPPPGYAGDMLLRIEITTIDGDSRATAVSYREVQVLPVDNDADGATLTFGTGADATTVEDVNLTVTTGGDYTDPGVAGLTGGGYALVWTGYDTDGSGIRAKVYGADGSVVSVNEYWGDPGDFTANTYHTGGQATPVVLGLADGGFAVFWHSFGQDGSEVGIHGQRFNETGLKVGAEFRVNTTTALAQEAPTATLLSDGGFVVLFESEPVNDAGFQIRGQRYDADGVAVGGEFLVRDKGGASQRWPDVTALENGGFAAVWTSYVSDGSGTALEMRIYDDRNDATVYRINEVTAGSQIDVKVTTLADGSFLATWTTQADQPGASHGIYARRFEVTESGLVGHDEFAVVRPSAGGSVAHPDVVGLPDGGWIVLWNWETPDDSGVDLFAQRYDAEGRQIGEAFRINAEAYGDQYSIDRYADPMVSLDANGDLLVVWHDARDGNVYSRRFDIDPDPPFVGDPGEAIKVVLEVTPTDAAETVEIVLSNLPAGVVLSAGEQQPDGSWRLGLEDLDGLTLTTPADYEGGDFDLVVTVTTRDGDDSFTTVAYKRVQVWEPAGEAPADTGAPVAWAAPGDGTGGDFAPWSGDDDPLICVAPTAPDGSKPADEAVVVIAEPSPVAPPKPGSLLPDAFDRPEAHEHWLLREPATVDWLL